MMGDRGPLAHNAYGLRPGPRRKPANTGAVRPVAGSAVEVMTSASNLAPLPAPEGLSPLGVVTWDALIVAIPGRHDILDAPTVARYAELTAERGVWAEQLVEHGHLLEEVIVSPRGDVVGTRRVVNPAVGELRRIDRALDTLGDRLGLSPAARGRLGLVVSQAEQALATSASLVARLEKL